MIGFFTELPAEILGLLHTPLGIAVVGVSAAAVAVLGGIQVHLLRVERREARRNNIRYGKEQS